MGIINKISDKGVPFKPAIQTATFSTFSIEKTYPHIPNPIKQTKSRCSSIFGASQNWTSQCSLRNSLAAQRRSEMQNSALIDPLSATLLVTKFANYWNSSLKNQTPIAVKKEVTHSPSTLT